MEKTKQTPEEALQMLYAYARKAQYQGPLEEATAHLEVLSNAAEIIKDIIYKEQVIPDIERA